MITVLPVRGMDAATDLGRGVQALLTAVDDEFVPPLSRRADTDSLEPARPTSVPVAYFHAMRAERWLVAMDGGEVAGILSFRIAANQLAPCPAWSSSWYVTTVAVSPGKRRRGVGTAMYNALHRLARERRARGVITRTWTSNSSHLALLEAQGFREIVRVPDARAAGEGTVYLALSLPAEE